MYLTKFLCLLAFATGRSIALSPPAFAPATSLSTENPHQNTFDGISVIVPDLFVVTIGLFASIPLMQNVAILNKMPIPRAKTSKLWQTMSKPYSSM